MSQTLSPQAIYKIAILYFNTHQQCQTDSDNGKYTFFRHQNMNISTLDTKDVLDEIYQFYRSNNKMIPMGYALQFNDDKILEGYGPFDEDYESTATAIEQLKLKTVVDSDTVSLINPISHPNIKNISKLIKQCTENRVAYINLESRESAILSSLGGCLQGYLNTLKSDMLKTCHAYNKSIQTFINSCNNVHKNTFKTLQSKSSRLEMFQFAKDPQDIKYAQLLLKKIKSELNILQQAINPNESPASKVDIGIPRR